MTPSWIVRPLAAPDCALLTAAFAAHGWDEPESKFRAYLAASEAGRRAALVAETTGKLAGYVTVVWEPSHAPFRAAGIPLIVDLNVLLKYRRQGAATALLDEAECLIAQRSPVAGLAVGLYPDYGPAQILYARRGYVPDGRGIWHGSRQVQAMESVVLDDEAVMYLTRQLA
jgi:GNAT superfamily N-acetyltransferase